MKLVVINGGRSSGCRSRLTANRDRSGEIVRLKLSEDISEKHLYKIADSIFSDSDKKKALKSYLDNMLPLGLKYVVITTLNKFLETDRDSQDILPLIPKKPKVLF